MEPEGHSLLEQTERLRKELGPCLLVVKCYELLGKPQSEIVPLAGSVVRGEIERLVEMNKRRYSGASLAEQFLRAIYALEMAGQDAQARSLFSVFFGDVNARCSAGGLSEPEYFRLLLAQIVVGDRRANLEPPPSTDTLLGRLSEAWTTSGLNQLAGVAEELTDLISAAEAGGAIAPDQDGWLYILLRRLRHELGGAAKANPDG